MIISKKEISRDIIQSYLNKTMFKIFLLGMISGLPWVLIGTSLTLWLKEDGFSRSAVGWSGLIFSVYAFNFLWAPLIDKCSIPYLTNKLGTRKSWILVMQILIILSLIIWSFLDINKIGEKYYLTSVIFVGLIIAISSATQDITIDALRIELVKKNEHNLIAAGASMTVIGWWTSFKLGGMITLFISNFLQNNGYVNYWQITFLCLTIFIILMNFGLLTIYEKNNSNNENLKKTNKFLSLFSWLKMSLINPIYSFFSSNGFKISIAILLFIFSFKIGEAFLGRMSVVFYKEIGFSKYDIGIFSKGLGWITTIVFTLIGGFLTIKSGIIRAIFIAGIFMALTNILFSFLAWFDKSYILFSFAVILDDIAAAFATVSFVALISLLVDRNYTATQYALLASIGTAGRTILASSSGTLVDFLDGDWGLFFIITSIMVIPSLLILLMIKKNLNKNLNKL